MNKKWIKIYWKQLMWNFAFYRNRKAQQALDYLEKDGETDETFPLKNAAKAMTGLVLFVSENSLFSNDDTLYINGDARAGSRRSQDRQLKIIRGQKGFFGVSRERTQMLVTPLNNEEMPESYFIIENG